MTSEQLFSICNTIVLPGWILLIVAPKWKWSEKIIVGIIITFLSITYAYIIMQHINLSAMQDFGSLGGVMKLFNDKNVVLGGWIHYLAFDLLAGLFQVKNGQKHQVHHLLIIPCLLLTFMLGPFGLLLFFIIRTSKTRNYFAENF